MDFINPDDKYNDVGTLLSPIITSDDASGWCVSFWYHMYGNDVNKLRAYYEVRQTPFETLWSRTGSQGPVWRYGQVNNSKIDIFSHVTILSASITLWQTG